MKNRMGNMSGFLIFFFTTVIFCGVQGGVHAEENGKESKESYGFPMMGRGMGMGMENMMGVCPMMIPKGKIKINPTKDGATLTITSDDPQEVKRIQKKMEIFKLMQELRESYSQASP